MLYVAEPSIRYRDSFLDALREFHAEGALRSWEAGIIGRDFAGFVERLRRAAAHPRQGLVPETLLWLIRRDDDGGETFIGRGGMRHELNDDLRRLGGHIGYAIRPSERRRGHGTEFLRLMLPMALELGINPVLITCDADNIGSRRIIERNGGVLEDEEPYDRDGEIVMKRRYWITL